MPYGDPAVPPEMSGYQFLRYDQYGNPVFINPNTGDIIGGAPAGAGPAQGPTQTPTELPPANLSEPPTTAPYQSPGTYWTPPIGPGMPTQFQNPSQYGLLQNQMNTFSSGIPPSGEALAPGYADPYAGILSTDQPLPSELAYQGMPGQANLPPADPYFGPQASNEPGSNQANYPYYPPSNEIGGQLPPYQAMDVPPSTYPSNYDFTGSPAMPQTLNAPIGPVGPTWMQTYPVFSNLPVNPYSQPSGIAANPFVSPGDTTSTQIQPIRPPYQAPDPNVQVFTSSNTPSNLIWSDAEQAWVPPPSSPDTGGGVGGDQISGQGGTAPPGLPADIYDTGTSTANVAFPVGPGAVPGASGVDLSYGTPGTGVPGTGLSGADVANMQNFGPNDPFTGLSPSQQAGFNTLVGGVSGGGGAGQFFRDAAGNIVNATGQVIAAAGQAAQSFVDNLPKDWGQLGTPTSRFDPGSPQQPGPLDQNFFNVPISYPFTNPAGQPTNAYGTPYFVGSTVPAPQSGTPVGTGTIGTLPNEWSYAAGRPFTNRRPMPYDQWQQYTGWENYQGNALGGVNWRQWAQQTGLPMPQSNIAPNYQAYLNQWNMLRPVIQSVAAARQTQDGQRSPGGGSRSHGTPATSPV